MLSAIALTGAAYLLWLGVSALRRPTSITAEHADDAPVGSALRSGLQGAAVSGLNPKGLLVFFAILPQFVVLSAAWSAPVQMAVLGLFHVFACAVVYAGVALGAKRLLRARPRAAVVVGRMSGAAMILISVVLVAEQAFHG